MRFAELYIADMRRAVNSGADCLPYRSVPVAC